MTCVSPNLFLPSEPDPNLLFHPMTPPPRGGIPCATCVKYTIFRWRLRRLLYFSYVRLYSSFFRFWLSFLMQNRIIHLFWAGAFGTYDPSHRCVSIHHFWVSGWVFSCKILYKPLCQGFVLPWTISLQISHPEYNCSKKWLNDAHRSRFVLGTHCWGALFPLGKSFIFS